MINLYLGDNLEAMRKMDDKQYDLAIVDPPYGININISMGRRKGNEKSNYHKFAGNDSCTPSQEYFDELMRVSKNQIIWGANYMIDKIKKPSSAWIVWNKLISNKMSFSSCELAWTSFNKTVKIFSMFPNTKEKRIHPTQKPIELYRWILEHFAKEGDKILDTHLGSGSIAIACHEMGFSLDAWELDVDYYTAASARLATHQQQQQLF